MNFATVYHWYDISKKDIVMFSYYWNLSFTSCLTYFFSQNIDRNQKIFDMNGKQFFLVDVIAHILHDLKCRLLTALKDDDTELIASDFDWVITVPAFWKDNGKSMMREAGYMVSP